MYELFILVYILVYLALTRLMVSNKNSSTVLHLYDCIKRGSGGIGFGDTTVEHSSLYNLDTSKHSSISSAFEIKKYSLNN